MKRILTSFFVLIFLISCSPKDRLDHSTHKIDITTNHNSAYILVGTDTTVQFQATIISPNGKVVDGSVHWAVTDTGGTTISSQGLYLVPTSIDQARPVIITATYDGVANSVKYLLVKELPTDAERALRYYMYADTYADIMNFKPNITNPSDEDGGYIGMFPNNLAHGFTMTTSSNAYEGIKSIKLAFAETPSGVGVNFQFGYDGNTNPLQTKNLNYTSLKFNIYSDDVSQIKVGIKSSNIAMAEYQTINITAGSWNVVSVNLTSFTLINKALIQQILFLTTTNTTGTVYIDNIYFE